MSLVTYLVRGELRRRWRLWLGVVVLIAIGGGTSMFAISAWQRTATAMDRFLTEYRPGNAIMVGVDLDHDAVTALPAVEDAESGEYFFLVPDGPDGRPDASALGDVNPFSSAYGRTLHGMSNARLLAGRLPDVEEELETVVDEELADAYDVGPGDVLPLTAISPEQLMESEGQDSGVPEGPRFELLVTGIIRRPSDVVPNRSGGEDAVHLGTSDLILTPAFHRAHFQRDVAGASLFDEAGFSYLELVLRPGVDAPALQEQVASVLPEAQVFLDPSEDTVATQVSDRAIGLQATAVLAVGIAVAVVASLLVLVVLARLLSDLATDLAPLRSAGLSLGSARAVTIGTAFVTALAGAVLALGLALALSPLSPIGLARRAEPDRGIHVEPSVLLGGVLLILAAAVGVAAVMASRFRPTPGAAASSWRSLPARLARRSDDVAVATGLRLAGRPGASRPATQATVLVACLGVVGSLTFAASAARAVEPDRYGWGWQLAVGNPNDGELFERLLEEVPRQRVVAAATAVHSGCGAALDHDGRHAEPPLVATEPLRGDIRPTMLSGRLPVGSTEVALGAVTARQLQAGVGDEVMVGSGDCGEGQQPMVVTGEVLFNEALLATRIGEGALIDEPALDALAVERGSGVILVDSPPGTGAGEARAALRREFGRVVFGPIIPDDLEALDRVRSLPTVVAGFLGVLALGTLGFTLGAGLRRSRRDLAVLKAIGLTPGQARRAILIQSTALVLAPAVVGTAVGVAAGRLTWGLVAGGLGAPDLPVVPLGVAAAAVPAVLVAALVVALRPVLTSARTPPSTILRAE